MSKIKPKVLLSKEKVIEAIKDHIDFELSCSITSEISRQIEKRVSECLDNMQTPFSIPTKAMDLIINEAAEMVVDAYDWCHFDLRGRYIEATMTPEYIGPCDGDAEYRISITELCEEGFLEDPGLPDTIKAFEDGLVILKEKLKEQEEKYNA